jgi:hypothetical protein
MNSVPGQASDMWGGERGSTKHGVCGFVGLLGSSLLWRRVALFVILRRWNSLGDLHLLDDGDCAFFRACQPSERRPVGPGWLILFDIVRSNNNNIDPGLPCLTHPVCTAGHGWLFAHINTYLQPVCPVHMYIILFGILSWFVYAAANCPTSYRGILHLILHLHFPGPCWRHPPSPPSPYSPPG